MKKYGFVTILTVLAIALLFSCAREHKGEMTIIHTNDMHTQFIPLDATWVKTSPKPKIGGMVALEYFINKTKIKYPNSLLLDAGDIMTGTQLSKIETKGALGGGFVEMMNLLNYDAYTVGNHEFDEGPENLLKLLDIAEFDVLSANLFINEKRVAEEPYKIYRVGNLRVGVIGIILHDLAGVVNKKNMVGVRVADPIKTTQEYIDKIDAKTDLIVVLTHQGFDEDKDLSEKIKNADLIVGGHSHTRLTRAIEKNGIVIVQTGSKTTNLGRITLDVQGDSIANYEYELISTWVDSVKNPNPALVKMVEKYQSQIDKEYDVVIGKLARDWVKTNKEESNLGNYLTDVMRKTTNTDFALLNSGGIRKNLPAGPITKLNIVEILPFSNKLVTFKCTGEQLLQLIEENARAMVENTHGVLQVSGLKYSFKVGRSNKISLANSLVNGEKIDPQKIYSGTTVDFILYGQAKKYFGFEPTETEQTGQLLSDVVIGYITKNPHVDAKIEDRIKRIDRF